MPPRKRASRTKRARKPSLIAALKRPSAYDHDVASVRVAETHISWVFLTGAHAYKVKKPVKFSFLDFAILDCTAPEAVLRSRIEARAAAGRDASEADLAVLDRQLVGLEPLAADEQAAAVRVATDARLDLPRLLAALTHR